MKLRIVFTVTFICLIKLTAQDNAWTKYVNHYQNALAAIGENNFESAISAFNKLLEITPHDADTHYRIARLYNLLGKKEEAFQSLKKSLELGHDFGDELDSALISLKKMKQFTELQILIDKMKTPVNKSEVAYRLSEKDLIPEGMAYDPVDKCFYMGSLWKCKIIKINFDGSFSDFTKEKQEGLRKVVGMKVDEQRRLLWAASIVNSSRPDISEDEIGWSGIFKYDLNTGKLIKKYTLFEKGIRHLFNDIDITSQGDVYFTDSDYNSVYRIMSNKDEIELFIDNEKFLYPNGIAFGKDDNTLYVASSGDGVYRIDVPTKQYRLLSQPDNICLGGIDGMYFYKNSLVCVQNGMNRISRFFLNEKGDAVKNMEIIETRNPHFMIPTTGAIAENTFYYTANSQMNKVNQDGTIGPTKNLDDVIILKTDLD